MKKFLSVFLALIICFTTCFGGIISVFAESSTYTIADMEGKYKTQGRVAISNNMLMIESSAAGIEFKANCSGSVSVNMTATRVSKNGEKGGIYFTVIVDGVVQYADMRIPEDNSAANWISNSTNYPFYMPDTGDYTFEIANNLAEGEHTFEIYTQTQANKGAFGISGVSLNGNLLDAPKNNDLYIEVVGDSIAAGQGNIATGGGSDSGEDALHQDATRGWGYLTAKALGADWSIVAQSGITATTGLSWAGAGSSAPSMNEVYPLTRYYSDKNTTYLFDRQADVILVCLGTNDIWLYDDASRGYNLSADDLKSSFKGMLTLLREKNSDAKIVWLYGMLTSEANDIITSVVSEMGGADKGYYSLSLPYDGSGGSYHPGLSVQTTYADTITKFIKKDILGEETVWDGSSISLPKGEGTSAKPYLISTPDELAYVIKSGGGENKHYKLTKDIYLNDIHGIDWETGAAKNGYVPNSWYMSYQTSAGFQGTIDGDGHTVYGLYVNMAPPSYNVYSSGTALIPSIAENGNVTIANLAIDCAYVNVETSAAAFVAVAPLDSYLTMDSCYAGQRVYLNAASASTIRAYARNATGAMISNCYSFATENGTTYSGLFGLTWDDNNAVVVSNCYHANGSFAGFDGSEYYMVVTDSYATGNITPLEGVTIIEDINNMQGLDVFESEFKMPTLNKRGAFTATNTYPVLNAFMPKSEDDETEIGDVWDGKEQTEPEGKGTKISPYLISNGAELAYAIASGGGANTYYKLTADIYLNDITKINWETGVADAGYTPRTWLENKNFQGTIDGNGYVVYGLYNNVSGDKVFGYYGCGLIPHVNSGTTVNVSRLGIDCAYVNGTNGAAAFVGFAGPAYYIPDAEYATVNIEQCYAGERFICQLMPQAHSEQETIEVM